MAEILGYNDTRQAHAITRHVDEEDKITKATSQVTQYLFKIVCLKYWRKEMTIYISTEMQKILFKYIVCRRKIWGNSQNLNWLIYWWSRMRISNIEKKMKRPVPTTPIPTPRKSVKQMVQEYEDDIIPHLLNSVIKIIQNSHQKWFRSIEIEHWNKKSHWIQTETGDATDERFEICRNTECHIWKDDTKWSITTKTAYSNSLPKAVLSVFHLEDNLKTSRAEINNKIAIWISQRSGWTIKCANDCAIYNPGKGSSYIPPPTELKHSTKGLINIQTEIRSVSGGATSDFESTREGSSNN